MAEIKTTLLVLLVAASIVLSVVLMVGQALPGTTADYQPVYFSPKPEIADISLPSRIQLVQPDGEINQVKTFSETYTNLIIGLSQLTYGAVGQGEVWRLSEQLPSPYAPGVLFRFDYPVSKVLLSSLLSNFHAADFPFETFDIIFVPYGLSQDADQAEVEQQQFGEVFFINEEEKEAWVLTGNLSQTLFQGIIESPTEVLDVSFVVMQPGAAYNVAPRVFDAAEAYTFQLPLFQGEDIDRTALVRAFNLDSSITRLIQEMDGAELFTDGIQALRIFPSGELEYTAVTRQPGGLVPSLADAIDRALDFVTIHGGWPGDMLLSQVNVLPGDQLRLDFVTVGLGLPLYGDHTGITVVLEGLSVSCYRRNLVFVQTRGSSLTYEVLPLSLLLEDTSTEAYNRVSNLDKQIQDVSLGLYWHQEAPHVVWRVEFDSGILLVSAQDGNILDEEWPGGGR